MRVTFPRSIAIGVTWTRSRGTAAGAGVTACLIAATLRIAASTRSVIARFAALIDWMRAYNEINDFEAQLSEKAARGLDTLRQAIDRRRTSRAL